MIIVHPLFAVSAVATLALSGAVQAHPKLLSSVPNVGATVARPHMIQLKFSERLIGPVTGADVVMNAMPPMPGMVGRPAVKIGGFATTLGADGKTLTMVRKTALQAGSYQVVWHAVSADTHRLAGRFAFSVK